MNFLKKLFGLKEKAGEGFKIKDEIAAQKVEEPKKEAVRLEKQQSETPEMAREGNFAVHKKGFFYTDEAFSEAGINGTIIGFYKTMETAEAAVKKADIASMLNLKGRNAVDFFLYANNYDEVYSKLQDYFKDHFSIEIKDRHYFEFPPKFSEADAEALLGIMDISFHLIIAYDDVENIDLEMFSTESENNECGEF